MQLLTLEQAINNNNKPKIEDEDKEQEWLNSERMND